MNIENKMKDRKNKTFWQALQIMLIVIAGILGMVIGSFLLWIRPTESILEKRELTKFPTFTWSSFINGEFTDSISTWYSDTFPFRENLLTAEQKLKTFYGIQTDSINNISEGDDIPDIVIPDTTDSPETSSEEAATADSSETSAAESAAETETTAESTAETLDPAAVAAEGDELVKMNPQEAGSVNIKDLVGYCVYGFNLNAANIYAQDVANVANALSDQCTVYEIMVPDNSAIMLDDETKTAWKLPDEHKAIKYYNAATTQLAPQVVNVDIYDTLLAHNSEYLYFYTDHHWTQLGAYYAYTCFCNVKGITPHSLDEYQQIVTTNFLGSYYSTSGYTQLADNPDTIYAYVPIATNTLHFWDDSLQCMREGNIVRDMNEYADTLKYMGFIYGDQSYEYIENPSLPDGDTCIVVKESFGNDFVPFLVDHYKKVIIIDYRAYTDSVVQLARDENAKDIIFLNNLDATADVSVMQVLGNICQ